MNTNRVRDFFEIKSIAAHILIRISILEWILRIYYEIRMFAHSFKCENKNERLHGQINDSFAVWSNQVHTSEIWKNYKLGEEIT